MANLNLIQDEKELDNNGIYFFIPIGNEPTQHTSKTSNGNTKHQLNWSTKYTEHQIT